MIEKTITSNLKKDQTRPDGLKELLALLALKTQEQIRQEQIIREINARHSEVMLGELNKIQLAGATTIE